jgi:integrase
MKTLATAMHRARKQGLIPTNPVEAIERPGQARQRGHEVFTGTEIELLLKASEGTEWETLIMLGAYTGQRLGDCARLQWTQLDLVEKTMSLTQQKTGETLRIPLHPRLVALLEARASIDRRAEFVCPTLAPRSIGGRGGLSSQFIDIMNRAGIDSRTEKQESGRAFSRRSFHSLRASFNTTLAERGVPQETRMKLTGHRSRSVNDSYTKPAMENLRTSINKL